MVAGDLMGRDVLTVYKDQRVADILDVFLEMHIHGAPVLDRDERLIGVVTQQDLFFATMTRSGETGCETSSVQSLSVGDIMTSPAVTATEKTELKNLCRLMHRLRIHRVPIVREGKVVGIVSSIDICGALARGAKIC
jgi:CBS domain-containing protein